MCGVEVLTQSDDPGQQSSDVVDLQAPSFLGCPHGCDGELRPIKPDPLPAPFASDAGLSCSVCARQFPYVDGVWVMWSDDVKRIQLEAPAPEADLADRIRWANVQIYDDISDDYGEHSDNLMPYREALLFLKALADDLQTKSTAPRVVVDVGCATGVGLDVGSNAYQYVVGVDISLQNLKAVAAKGYTAVLGDAGALPFAAGSIDLVTCFAAMHHFPSPEAFVNSAQRCLRSGGVLATGCDPSARYGEFSTAAKLVWDARKPAYRFLSQFSDRFYLHKDTASQELGDLAEYQRTHGGFAPDWMQSTLRSAGFEAVKVFFGVDPDGNRRFDMPQWKVFVLKALSLQNPVRRENWVTLSSLARKP